MNIYFRKNIKNHPKGFTLIELAVVIFLIGMLAAIGLTALKAQLVSASTSATKKKEDAIKDAMIAFLGRNGRFPCPSNNFAPPDGIENRPCNTSSAAFGIIPYQTLGLSKSDVMDGWENFFSYAVSSGGTPYVQNQDWTVTQTIFSHFAANSGVIGVSDRTSTLNNTAAIIISHGVNGLGAYTSKGTRNQLPDSALSPDEFQNTFPLGFTTFYNRQYTDNTGAAGGTFDDIVLALSPHDLLNPLIKDGALQSAQSQYAAQVVNIQDWVASQISAVGCSVPSALPAANPNLSVDPWGNSTNTGTVFIYSRISPAYSSGNPTQVIYTLTNSTPSATPSSVQLTSANLLRTYPFLAICP